MREFKFINFNKGKNYYLIEINRPNQLNAINKETIKELKDCFLSIKNSTKGFYGVIITGSGDKSFVAGADISEFKGLNEKTAKELSLNGHELFDIIENFSIPVIALVNGYALGGGCELALCCHIRIATKNAKFFSARNKSWNNSWIWWYSETSSDNRKRKSLRDDGNC